MTRRKQMQDRSLPSVAMAVIICCLALSADNIFAQTPSTAVSTAQREDVAQKFAQEHHPELATLLSQLKEMDEKKYTAAINELFRTSERIGRYQERSPERYQLELELWKIDSRVRLLVARSTGGMEEETRLQIKKLLTTRNRLRVEQLTSERDRIEDRLGKINEQITALKTEDDTLIDRDLERLMRSAKTRSKTRKKVTSPQSQAASTRSGQNNQTKKPTKE